MRCVGGWIVNCGALTLQALVIATALATSVKAAVRPYPRQVRNAINEVRNTRAGLYDSFTSSTLGRIAAPREMAATQKDLRAYYYTVVPRLDVSHARRQELGRLYGRVSLFGRPRAGRPFSLGITGAHVIDVQGRPELVVVGLERGSPAARALKHGDVIVGANNRLFPRWEDPRVPIGYAIAASQTAAFKGALTLHVGREGRLLDARVNLPIGDDWGPNWPFDCRKSRKIADDAVQFVLANKENSFWRDLFVMGLGDGSAVANVGERLKKLRYNGSGLCNWGESYRLVSLAEYHLLTGDRSVLPIIRDYVKGIEGYQMGCGGWSHGAPGG